MQDAVLTTDNMSFPAIKPLTSADTLGIQWRTTLLPFWQNMQSGILRTDDGLQLSYFYHCRPDSRYAVVISSGRIEAAIKYAELCYDFVEAGYSVFLLDHRGQGFSQRELANRHKGYVSDFAHYQADLAKFIANVVLPTGHKYHLALGHSMGSAILAGYLATSHPFQAAILASPMLGIYTGLVPRHVAEPLALTYSNVNQLLSKKPWYFPGQGNYTSKAFAGNVLTSDATRFAWLQQLYCEYPEIQLGGVTSSWIKAAISHMRNVIAQAPNWATPVLLLQAAEDKVVSNQAQDSWFSALPSEIKHQKLSLHGARHEIFMEQDAIRQQAYNAINSFIAGLSC